MDQTKRFLQGEDSTPENERSRGELEGRKVEGEDWEVGKRGRRGRGEN